MFTWVQLLNKLDMTPNLKKLRVDETDKATTIYEINEIYTVTIIKQKINNVLMYE